MQVEQQPCFLSLLGNVAAAAAHQRRYTPLVLGHNNLHLHVGAQPLYVQAHAAINNNNSNNNNQVGDGSPLSLASITSSDMDEDEDGTNQQHAKLAKRAGIKRTSATTAQSSLSSTSVTKTTGSNTSDNDDEDNKTKRRRQIAEASRRSRMKRKNDMKTLSHEVVSLKEEKHKHELEMEALRAELRHCRAQLHAASTATTTAVGDNINATPAVMLDSVIPTITVGLGQGTTAFLVRRVESYLDTLKTDLVESFPLGEDERAALKRLKLVSSPFYCA